MRILTITDVDDKEHVVDFPETLAELPLKYKISFDVYREDLTLWVAKNKEDKTLLANRTYYLYLVAKCVSQFIRKDLNTVLRFDASELVDSQGELLPLVLSKHFEKLTKLESVPLDSFEPDLLSLFDACVRVADSYEFEFKTLENCNFTLKGVKYRIPHIVTTLFNSRKVFSNFSVQRSVMNLNIRKFLATFDTKKLHIKANKRYSSFLKIIAATVEVVGEEPVYDELEFIARVEKRLLAFVDIDTKLAYDIGFFLTTSIKP